MATKKASEAERNKALLKARKALQKARDELPSEEQSLRYLSFMSDFSLTEAAYKSLLADWLRARGKPTRIEDLKFRSDQIPRVLSYYSIEISNEDRTLIFDGRNKTGERNARGLRNSLVHSPNTKAIEELSEKYDAISTSMQTFEAALSASNDEKADS